MGWGWARMPGFEIGRANCIRLGFNVVLRSMEPDPPPPPPMKERLSPLQPAAPFLLSTDALIAARQRQNKSTTVLTLPTGQKYHLELMADGSEKLTTSELLGRSDGFVADVKPDDAVCQVLPGLFIGSQDGSRNLQALTGQRVTHIVNAAAGAVENAYPSLFQVRRSQRAHSICLHRHVFFLLQYLSLELLDIPDFDINPYFQETWKFMEAAISSGGGVFVHCNAGISRSSTLVISYLIKFGNMRYNEAYQLVKTARPAILPNGGFQKILRELENQTFPS